MIAKGLQMSSVHSRSSDTRRLLREAQHLYLWLTLWFLGNSLMFLGVWVLECPDAFSKPYLWLRQYPSLLGCYDWPSQLQALCLGEQAQQLRSEHPVWPSLEKPSLSIQAFVGFICWVWVSGSRSVRLGCWSLYFVIVVHVEVSVLAVIAAVQRHWTNLLKRKISWFLGKEHSRNLQHCTETWQGFVLIP